MDIFCLQEVWYADIQRQIYNGVKDYYPYALSTVDLNDSTVSSEPACTIEILAPANECRVNECSEFASNALPMAICWVTRYVLAVQEPSNCILYNCTKFLSIKIYGYLRCTFALSTSDTEFEVITKSSKKNILQEMWGIE